MRTPSVSGQYDGELLERARMQWQFGDWESLVQIDDSTLESHPARAQLALLMANAHHQLDNHADAARLIQLSQTWGCDYNLICKLLIAGVYNTLGRAAALMSDEDAAKNYFQKAVDGVPGDLRLAYQARVTYEFTKLGKSQQATSIISAELTTLQPAHKRRLSITDRAKYLNDNGETLYKAGNYKLASEYFDRALQLAPHNAWYCQNLAEAFARLKAKKGEPWECEQLGNAFDETGKWDVAVRHYRRALKLDPTVVQAHQRAQTFTVEPAREGQIDNPIFIVGCGHSGTSILLAILGNHPELHPIPKESALFLQTDDTVQKTMHKWDEECNALGKRRWIEKTPPHIFQIHRFLALRPKAKFVLILRDGRDVVCSLRSRIGYAAFEDRLDRWIYDNLAGLPYFQHPQVKVVRYEDLIVATEATLRDLCSFIGEGYSAQMLEYHRTEHRWYSDKIVKPESIDTHEDHTINRNWQINQPLFDGRGRWRYEMTEAEKAQFKASPAQPLLEQLGYTTHIDW